MYLDWADNHRKKKEGKAILRFRRLSPFSSGIFLATSKPAEEADNNGRKIEAWESDSYPLLLDPVISSSWRHNPERALSSSRTFIVHHSSASFFSSFAVIERGEEKR